MSTRILTGDSYLHSEGGNSQVIISSHGGIPSYDKKSTLESIPFNLHFMVHGNRSTSGMVTWIASMTEKEFFNEPKGTSGIPDHDLTHYPHDTQKQIDECVQQQGMDVVTIRPNSEATLKSVLKALHKFSRYTDVYCLFCRGALGKEKIPTVSKSVMAELKQKLAKH